MQDTPKGNIEDIYPLAPIQQGLVFHTLAAPTSGVYVVQYHCALAGDLNVPAFRRAWEHVFAQHPVLRTLFVLDSVDKWLQVVRDRVDLPFEEHDWREVEASEQEKRFESFLASDRRAGFDLAKAPLSRFALIRLAEDVHKFVWTIHHAVVDGWSISMLLDEVFQGYRTYCRGEEIEIRPVRPYRDYIRWLKRQDERRAEDYWRQALEGFDAATPLPAAHAPVEMPGEDDLFATHRAVLSPQATGAVTALARRHQLTINTAVQGAWALLLGCYSGEQDVLYGATVSGRPAELAEVDSMVGVFINSLPVRVQIPAETSVVDWLKDLQARQIEAREYQYSSLVEIHGSSGVPRRQPLFETLLVYENFPLTGSGSLGTAGITVRDAGGYDYTHYPLTVCVTPGNQLHFRFIYDRRRFDASSISELGNRLGHLMEMMAARPNGPVSQLPIITESERHRLVVQWNQTATSYPRDKTIQDLFEQQVIRAPEAVAVVFEGEPLTYRELNARANRLAHHLRSLGVGPEVPVAICIDRSLEMVVALLGVLKAGGAYLPLDPDSPPQRLLFMVEDTQAPVVLTLANRKGRFSGYSGRVFCLDADWGLVENESDENPRGGPRADDLAYVIYTSGSTGQPKGVEVTHGALLNLIHWHVRAYEVTAADRATQLANVAFDACVWELWPYLAVGASVYLADEEALSEPDRLWQWLAANRITVTFVPTPLAEAALPCPLPKDLRLRAMLTGGDRLHKGLERPLPFTLLNHYGPTENTVVSTWAPVSVSSPHDPPPPIGRPVDNVRLYVLDTHVQPVPIGVPGELYVGGASLARGYRNRPKLTADYFVDDPFSTEPESRLYKTGDLVRYLPDGNLQFIGRSDGQVKIRGYRIELGEIDSVLRQHPGISEAVAVATEDTPGDKRLAAYVVFADGQRPETAEIRDYLKEKLPAYMVPSVFVLVSAIPLSPNGKIDRKALPAPEANRPESEAAFVAPESGTERSIAAVWQEVLHVKRVGVHDNFFDLGGHSLLLARVQMKLRDRLQREVPMMDLFEYPTISTLSRSLSRQEDRQIDLRKVRTLAAKQEAAVRQQKQRLREARERSVGFDRS